MVENSLGSLYANYKPNKVIKDNIWILILQ
jgi:hypothetical protein